MKNSQFKYNIFPGLLCLLILAGLPRVCFSQCIPDVINCIDIDEPGQICPKILAEGFVGVEYEEHITIIAPDSAKIGTTTIALVKVVLSSIENLPPGITYTAETLDYYPNEAYCVSLLGIPRETGTFYLKISVVPYMMLFDNLITLPVQIDSTSVYLTISAASSTNPGDITDFSLIQAFPNPFERKTRIGFNDPDPADTELLIFSMMGQQLYSEFILPKSGQNFFEYTGEDLPPGYYFYTIRKKNRALYGRLVKNR